MRWRILKLAGLLSLLVVVACLWVHTVKQDERVRLLREDVRMIKDTIPAMMRAEFAAHERRMVAKLEEHIRDRED